MKKRIEELPEKKVPRVQSESERDELITKWKDLVAGLPYCEIRTAKEDGEISDNQDIYGKALFIVVFSHDMSYHESAYADIYFLFLPNGSVETVVNESLSYLDDVDDPAARAIVDFGKQYFGAWSEGYHQLIELIEEAYSAKIDSLPR